jgi:hypothetical protein
MMSYQLDTIPARAGEPVGVAVGEGQHVVGSARQSADSGLSVIRLKDKTIILSHNLDSLLIFAPMKHCVP